MLERHRLRLRDAREISRKTLPETAKATGISPVLLRSYEEGHRSPALPELEVLAYFLGIPMQHFWSNQTLADDTVRVEPLSLDQISGLLIGRAHGYSDAEKVELDQMIVKTVVEQFGAAQLPIVSNMDFGHTDPQWLLPLGISAELDCEQKTFRLVESALV